MRRGEEKEIWVIGTNAKERRAQENEEGGRGARARAE